MHKLNEWLFAKASRIPVLGMALLIANAYACDGDFRASQRFAPLSSWLRKLGPQFTIAIAAAWFVTPTLALTGLFELPLAAYMPEFVVGCVPDSLLPLIVEPIAVIFPEPLIVEEPVGKLTVAILPNLLGFGIGVYGLIFALSPGFVKAIQKHLESKASQPKTESQIAASVLMLNADMAYPLLAITVALALGIVQGLSPNSALLEVVTWIALWYSLLMLLEILSALFSLGEAHISEKLVTSDSSDPEGK